MSQFYDFWNNFLPKYILPIYWMMCGLWSYITTKINILRPKKINWLAWLQLCERKMVKYHFKNSMFLSVSAHSSLYRTTGSLNRYRHYIGSLAQKWYVRCTVNIITIEKPPSNDYPNLEWFLDIDIENVLKATSQTSGARLILAYWNLLEMSACDKWNWYVLSNPNIHRSNWYLCIINRGWLDSQ